MVISNSVYTCENGKLLIEYVQNINERILNIKETAINRQINFNPGVDLEKRNIEKRNAIETVIETKCCKYLTQSVKKFILPGYT